MVTLLFYQFFLFLEKLYMVQSQVSLQVSILFFQLPTLIQRESRKIVQLVAVSITRSYEIFVLL